MSRRPPIAANSRGGVLDTHGNRGNKTPSWSRPKIEARPTAAMGISNFRNQNDGETASPA